jgi:phospholipase/lecithinase/hemolysin
MTDTDIAMTILLVVIAGTMGVAYYAVKGWGEALKIANETVKHHNELLKEALELYEEYDDIYAKYERALAALGDVAENKITVVLLADGSVEFVPVK